FGIIEQVAVSNASDNATISKDLKELVRTDARIILLYCMEGDTLNILQVAKKLNLMTNEYLWFLTFEAINKNRQLNANNLPLGMLGIYYEYREDEMEEAIKTAVAVWFRGLHQSVMASAPPGGLPTGLPWSLPNFNCQSRHIMRNVSFDNVAFNELGQLKFKDITIVNVQPPMVGEEDQKWRQVGKFTTDGIQMRHITWPGETIHPPLGRPRRHVLRIVTREELPFVEYREASQNGTCGHFSYICQVFERDENKMRISNVTVKRCCTGLSIDFLHRLSQTLNFDFVLYEVEDYQWGTKFPDGTWDGIVGDLRSGKADMAVASMTIDEDRRITFMVAIRDGAISTTAFLVYKCILFPEPYDYPAWCIILVCSVHITGASIFFFEWFSPNGLDHGRRLSSTYKFSLFRTFWLMWAMLFGAAFVTNIWALFALVFTASYTANLAAFMITKEEYHDLTGMHDRKLQYPMSMSPPFRFGTMPNGTTENNIKKNNLHMYEYMKRYSQRSVEQAMEALLKQKLDAFIYDASVLEYQEGKDRDCKLITVGNWYATTGYGVGFPFGSPWLERVNNVILNLQSEGEMERLKEFWLAGACHTKRKKNTNNRGIGHGVSSSTLGILNFTSAFIFLAAGTCLAILTFVLEYMYFWFGRKRLSSWDKRGCCALISLSMGMSLSFQESVHEAWDAHRKSKQKCTSATCESKLSKVNRDLRLARIEIYRLQSELA
ncbi:unnamed protein product, partial [Candidula unifasciata]